MSLSKVYSRFSWDDEAHPVGSEQFVDQFFRQREEASSEGKKQKLLEQQHQTEVQQAYQNGYAQGEAVGLQRGLNETRRVEEQLAASIKALTEYRQAVYENGKSQLVELAFAIADRVTASRGAAERDTVIETINRCVTEILDKSQMKIKVNPSEVAFVKQRFDDVVSKHDAAANAVVEGDARVSPGGCIIETDSGSADARIESQLRLLHDKLVSLEQ